MACQPGHIQIRRDDRLTWEAVNPILKPGELAYAYPDNSNPYGILKIGLAPNGTTWNNSPTLSPSSGGGGGGATGATGPAGTSAFQFIAYEGTPVISPPVNAIVPFL